MNENTEKAMDEITENTEKTIEKMSGIFGDDNNKSEKADSYRNHLQTVYPRIVKTFL